MKWNTLKQMIAMLYYVQVQCSIQRSLLFAQLEKESPDSSVIGDVMIAEFVHIYGVMTCGHVCGLMEDCMAVSYNKTGGVCQLYNFLQVLDNTDTDTEYLKVRYRNPPIVNCREDLIEDVTADKLTSSSVYAIGYEPDRARLTTLYGDDGTGGQGAWSSRTIDFDQYIQVSDLCGAVRCIYR
ncbi:hypothetical protein ScPMuIL_009487 [Solemya velum]